MNKSDRIRTLASEGKPRAEIARELGIRYQHVRNVLERDKEKREKAAAHTAPQTDRAMSQKIKLGPDGRIVIPAAFREALALKEGHVLFARLEDGEIHLLTPKAAMQRAQALLRQFVPEGVSLVGELIQQRRSEAQRESEND